VLIKLLEFLPEGEIEDYLKQSSFTSVSIVRPSLLLGDRKNLDWEKKRVLFHEDIFLYLVVVLKIQTIESETVAKLF
jgi:hypothetical protein